MRTVTADVYVAALDVPGIKMFLPQVCSSWGRIGRREDRGGAVRGAFVANPIAVQTAFIFHHILHPIASSASLPPAKELGEEQTPDLVCCLS